MASTVEFEDSPPRPKGGSGEVIVKVGNANVTLNWVDEQLSEVVASDEGDMSIMDMSMKEQKLGIVSCMKCARDSDTGAMVCWPVAC